MTPSRISTLSWKRRPYCVRETGAVVESSDDGYRRSVTVLRSTLACLSALTAAMSDRALCAQLHRQIIEGVLQNAVTTFQVQAESLYQRLPARRPVPRNLFQNLRKGSDLWRRSTGRGFEDHLGETAFLALNRHFQRRHLLAHRQGVVDQEYLLRSGDTSCRFAQRIDVPADEVQDCLDLLDRLVGRMTEDASGVDDSPVRALWTGS